MTTAIGVLGARWRADVSAGGTIQLRDRSPELRWWVAADDRWHDPESEPSRRQRRLLGAPVFETAVRVPGGDVLQRAYAVPDHGGLVVSEIENASPMAVVVALSRPDLLLPRSVTAKPIGIDLPAGSVAVPIGHRSSVRVALPVGRRPAAGLVPDDLPGPEQVARGWVSQTDRGVRVVTPTGADAIVAARSRLLLEGPQGGPAEQLLGYRELARLGVSPLSAGAVARLVESVGRVARRNPSWVSRAALHAAAELLVGLGEDRAVADTWATIRALRPIERPALAPSEPGALLAWVVEGLALVQDEGVVDLFSGALGAWRGENAEVYGVPVGAGTLGVALRWHGARPALLWESTVPVRLTASTLDPTWSTTEPKGEALLAEPA